jgi:hypothetical protein
VSREINVSLMRSSRMGVGRNIEYI